MNVESQRYSNDNPLVNSLKVWQVIKQSKTLHRVQNNVAQSNTIHNFRHEIAYVTSPYFTFLTKEEYLTSRCSHCFGCLASVPVSYAKLGLEPVFRRITNLSWLCFRLSTQSRGAYQLTSVVNIPRPKKLFCRSSIL